MISWSSIIYLKGKGYDNTEISKKLGVNRVSVSRKFSKLKGMSDEEYKVLLRDCILGVLN